MKRLVCKENPSIYIVAPEDMITEVGGNCWHINGPQPLTYPKCLWVIEDMPNYEEKIKKVEE